MAYQLKACQRVSSGFHSKFNASSAAIRPSLLSLSLRFSPRCLLTEAAAHGRIGLVLQWHHAVPLSCRSERLPLLLHVWSVRLQRAPLNAKRTEHPCVPRQGCCCPASWGYRLTQRPTHGRIGRNVIRHVAICPGSARKRRSSSTCCHHSASFSGASYSPTPSR